MRACKIVIVSIAFIGFYTLGYAQQRKCGYAAIATHLQKNNSDFKQQLDSIKYNSLHLGYSKASKASATAYTVPVVFHFVLNASQQQFLGGNAGMARRVSSQLAVLNEDYNGANADQAKVPAAFKALYGNANIKFALAHTAPNGDSTQGWEMVTTQKLGFDLNDNECSGAKHKSTGGADAWDVSSYLNIWIINITIGNITGDVIGITVPPAFTDSSKFSNPYPKDEMGIVLRYNVFGRKEYANDSFFYNFNLGRTCTHEMGHYFGLFHTWGDDDSGGVCRCPWDVGGGDDGIADTPPEGCTHYGCYVYPYPDDCTSGNGIMYWNYMDYTDDSCMYMFTTEQVARMDYNISVVGESHGLTGHPQLLEYPGGTVQHDDTYILYPLPTVSGRTSLNFNQFPVDFQGYVIYNSLGQQVQQYNANSNASTYYPINLSGNAKGIYIIKIIFNNHTEYKKILVL
jgi:hypothetical protein